MMPFVNELLLGKAQVYQGKHGVVQHVLIIGIYALTYKGLAFVILNLLYAK